MSAVRGACLCGSVRYAVAPPYRWSAYCHCSMCRKQHGALFDTGLGVSRENFTWLAGDADIVHYRASSTFERPFCRQCGSKLPAASHLPDVLHVPAGTLDGDFGVRPDKHIFVGSKSPSAQITDRLPQFATYPPRTRLAALERPRLQPACGVTRGSCLCGSVVFEVDGVPKAAVHCHCSRCRRSRGSAFATTTLVAAERFRFTRGAELLRTYKLREAARYGTTFCTRCGSLLPSIFPGYGAVIPVGTLDTDVEIPVIAHLFVGSKAPWYEISDSLPQYVDYPPPELIRELM